MAVAFPVRFLKLFAAIYFRFTPLLRCFGKSKEHRPQKTASWYVFSVISQLFL